MKDSSKKLIKDPDVLALIRSAVNYTLSELTLRESTWTNIEFEDLVMQNVASLAETGEPVRGTLGSDESKEIDDLVAGSTLAAIPVPQENDPESEPIGSVDTGHAFATGSDAVTVNNGDMPDEDDNSPSELDIDPVTHPSYQNGQQVQ